MITTASRAPAAAFAVLETGSRAAGQCVLFLLPLGLAFSLVGYVPEHLRLLLFYLLLLVPALVAAADHRFAPLSVLVCGALLHAAVNHNPLFQMSLLLLMHFLVWSCAARRWLKLYPAVIAFALLYTGLFLSPLGYYPVEALTGHMSALFTRLLRAPCSLGFTYQNTGSALLFLALSVSLCRSRVGAVRAACFAVLLVLVTALMLKLVLYRLDLNLDHLLKLGVYEYTEDREYVRFYGHTAALFFPGLLFLAHLCLFGIYHVRDACSEVPEAGGAP